MGYIDLKDFCLATILSQLKDWMNTTPTTLWGDIENNMTPGNNLKNWLLSTPTRRIHLTHYSPTIRASIKAWKTLHYTKWSQLLNKTIQIPLHMIQFLSQDLNIHAWFSEQANHISELCTKVTSKPFTQIQRDYNAPTKDYFTYYRLQQCLLAHLLLEGTLPTKIQNFLFTENIDSKGISPFYSTLQEKTVSQIQTH